MPTYAFTCKKCSARWEMETDDPTAYPCKLCKQRGVTSTVSFRRKRSDAKKRGVNAGNWDSLLFNREPRAKRKPERLNMEEPDIEDDEEEEEDSREDDKDPLFAPTPLFSPAMRYSGGGSFLFTRLRVKATTMKTSAWMIITTSSKIPRITSAQFGGESAETHGNKHASDYKSQSTHFGSKFEWCHLIADCLGGPTTANNLCCGSYHANTAMLCLENVLCGKTWLEVKVEVQVRTGTQVAEKITYKVRRASLSNNRYRTSPKKNNAMFSTVIDGLADGCTESAGRELAGDLKGWLTLNGLNKG